MALPSSFTSLRAGRSNPDPARVVLCTHLRDARRKDLHGVSRAAIFLGVLRTPDLDFFVAVMLCMPWHDGFLAMT
jgi:hypothetical protein